ncbi:hypothetical protein MSPP1_002408 [Malassezia sp. CBS 17886]|nr:hypothetical protein MSPP1_002408 [Malassezia sp. CBS 17886]
MITAVGRRVGWHTARGVRAASAQGAPPNAAAACMRAFSASPHWRASDRSVAVAEPTAAATGVYARDGARAPLTRGAAAKTPRRRTKSSRTKDVHEMEPMYAGDSSVAADALLSAPHLPHPSLWKRAFSFTKESMSRHRYFVANRDTVRDIVASMDLGNRDRHPEKVTVIEAYAGPGTLTRELMQHPNVERVVALENVHAFLPWLEALKHDPTLAVVRDKLRILPESGFSWDAYETLVAGDYLAHLQGRIPNYGRGAPPLDWSAPSPIVFVAQLPNTVHGEQLYAQLVHAISSGFWLFKYGRVPMTFVCGESIATRSLAQPQDHRNRAKLGTTVQCLAAPRLVTPAEQLLPYADHFYPPTAWIGPRVPITSTFIPNSNISSGLSKRNLCVMQVDPLEQPLVSARDMDSFEFLTRNLFVLKTKPIADALK